MNTKIDGLKEEIGVLRSEKIEVNEEITKMRSEKIEVNEEITKMRSEKVEVDLNLAKLAEKMKEKDVSTHLSTASLDTFSIVLTVKLAIAKVSSNLASLKGCLDRHKARKKSVLLLSLARWSVDEIKGRDHKSKERGETSARDHEVSLGPSSAFKK
jgi:chromosome segregation ATPase